MAQVNTVEFGQNRLQYNNFKWKYYQTKNFNTYFYDNGQPLAKFVPRSPKRNYLVLNNSWNLACSAR